MSGQGWYLPGANGPKGPFSDADIAGFIGRRELTATDRIWHPDMDAWTKVADVQAWRPALEAAAPRTPAPLPESASPQAPEQRGATRPPQQLGGGYLLQHWRGELPLALSFWVNGILINAAFALVAVDLQKADFTSLEIGDVVLSLSFGLILVIVLWQVIGIWRSAGKYMQRGGNTVWAVLARIVVLLWLLSPLWDLSSVRQLAHQAADDRQHRAHEIRVLDGGSELEVSGTFGYGLTAELKQALVEHPSVRAVRLSSPGGSVREARRMRSLIAQRRLQTHVTGECLSACVLAFMGGSERLLGPDGRLALHSFSVEGTPVRATSYEPDYAFARSRGIDTALLEQGFNMAPDAVFVPTPLDLLYSRLVTRVADGSDAAPSEVQADAEDEGIAALPLFRALKAHEPEAYLRLLKTYQDTRAHGATVADAGAAIRLQVHGIVLKRLPLASDDALIGYSGVLVEVLNSLRKRSPALCHAYVHGLSPDAGESFEERVPPWTMLHEEDMATQIIASSAATADNAGLKSAQLRALNATLVQRLRPLHGQALQWLQETNLNDAQRYAVCNLHIAMLSTLNTLPPEQSAPLIRDWFQRLR